jgi:chaperonin GroES
MDYRPMHDRIVVRQDEAETRTSAGFIIPDAAAKQTNTGVIVACGPGRVNKDGVTIPMTVKAGDKIMFPLGTGIKVTVGGEALLVMKEEDLLAIVGE